MSKIEGTMMFSHDPSSSLGRVHVVAGTRTTAGVVTAHGDLLSYLGTNSSCGTSEGRGMQGVEPVKLINHLCYKATISVKESQGVIPRNIFTYRKGKNTLET